MIEVQKKAKAKTQKREKKKMQREKKVTNEKGANSHIGISSIFQFETKQQKTLHFVIFRAFSVKCYEWVKIDCIIVQMIRFIYFFSFSCRKENARDHLKHLT